MFGPQVDKSAISCSPIITRHPTDPRSVNVTFRCEGVGIGRAVLHWNGEHEMWASGDGRTWSITLPLRREARICYQIEVFRPSNAGNQYMTGACGARYQVRGPRRVLVGDSWFELSLPDAPRQQWNTAIDNVLSGTVEVRRLWSRTFRDERSLLVYLPAGYSTIDQHALLLLLSSMEFAPHIAPITLDNLAYSGRIRSTAVVFVGNSPSGERWKELRCCGEICDFVTVDLLPWIEDNYKISHKPSDRVVGGYSRGGLAAAWVALNIPEAIGNVISHSGSFWWAPDYDSFDPTQFNRYAEPGWLIREVISRPKRNVRFYLDAGTYEDKSNEGNILGFTRHFRDVLIAKGYDILYQEFVGGHDFLHWRATIADAMHFLLPVSGVKAMVQG